MSKTNEAGGLSRRQFVALSSGAAMAGSIAPKTLQSAEATAAGEQPEWPVLTEYTGENLREIAFPLGGIGTGSIALGGRGNLRDWEIMNRPSKGFAPKYGFFAIRTQQTGADADTRVLEGNMQPPFEGSHGIPDLTAGLPRFREVHFRAAYPLASIDFSDPANPLKITQQTWNPLIPMDADNSGLPIIEFRYQLENTTALPVDVAIMAVLTNFIGSDGVDLHPGNAQIDYTDNRSLASLNYRADITPEKVPQNGTMTLSTPVGDGVSYGVYSDTGTQRGRKNDLLHCWDDFSENGTVGKRADDQYPIRTGALASRYTLQPGERKEISFYLTWHFPHRTVGVSNWVRMPNSAAHRDTIVGNYYTTEYNDALSVARGKIHTLPQLERQTVAFVNTICQSTMTQSVKEAILNNLSTLRTQTCFRLADGHLLGFEGTSDDQGCCPGSCTHVWNYETATAHLFPELARTMRDVELTYSQHENGSMAFRSPLPLDQLTKEIRPSATDGQMGVIMKTCREWQMSGDDDFLRTYWPMVKKALAYAWIPKGWDANQDGVMEGVQHNTYDVEFYGPNAMLSVWYLGALHAAEQMARAVGDNAFADKCQTLYESGSRWIDENLFNGEYYTQIIRGVKDISDIPDGQTARVHPNTDHTNPDYQVGTGCLVDQLVGQYMASLMDLGYMLNRDNVRKTVESIYKYNYRTSLYNHFNNRRTYALNDESAVLICSWPKGGRPEVPFVFFSEVMTGFEYQAAILMIYEGLLDEAHQVVASIRDRYDGIKRNPWDEAECGHHYARAMASWSLVPALSGFHYSGVRQSIRFDPVIKEERFAACWTAGTAWGAYYQDRYGSTLQAAVQAHFGSVTLRECVLGAPGGASGKVAVIQGNDTISAKCRIADGRAVVTFDNPVQLNENETLEIRLS